MSLDFPLVCPGCFCVAPSPDDWCEAVARVTRPDQVRHLIQVVPQQCLPMGWTAAGSVARFMADLMAKGRLRYIPDPDGCDLWGPPYATLMRGGGDCDDLSALALSMLHAMGVDADMMIGFHCSRGRCEGHAWVEGRDHGGRFVIEATAGLLLWGRPKGYRPHYQLRPGRCLDIRDARTKQAATRARSSAAVPSLGWVPA